MNHEFPDRYRVGAAAHHGGYGSVFEATDAEGQSRAVLKVSVRDDEECHASIRREISALLRFHDSGVVRMLAHGETRSGPWVALERLDAKPFAPDATTLDEHLSWFRDIARCLSILHEGGLVHLDICPDNTMCRDGRPVLIDFGSALTTFSGPCHRAVVEEESVPRGRWAYMAPEVLRSEIVDARADVFSLGVMMYEAFVGEQPYDHADIAAFFSGGAVELPSVDGLDAPLADLIRELLEPTPSRRLAEAASVEAQLDRLLDDAGDDRRPRSRTFLLRSSLVGRDVEFGRLRSYCEASRDQARSAYIVGEGGIGKTRLLADLSQHLTWAGWTTLPAVTASGRAGLMPFSGFSGVIAAVAAHRNLDVPEWVTDLWRTTQRGEADETAAETRLRRTLGETGKASLFFDFGEVLERFVEDQPVFVPIDDIDLKDEFTSEFLDSDHFAKIAARLVVCATVSAAHRNEMAGSRPGFVLELGRIGEAETRRMLHEALGRSSRWRALRVEGLFYRIAELAEGNPLFAAECLRNQLIEGRLGEEALLERDGDVASLRLPSTVAELLERRLDLVDAEARGVIACAAVLGTEFDLDDLTATCDATQREIMTRVERLVAARVLDATEQLSAYRFSHSAIRSIVLKQIDPEVLVRLNRTAAEHFEQSRNPQRVAGRIGRFLLDAGEDARAVGWLVRAADESTRRGLTRSAADHIQSALAADQRERSKGRAGTLDRGETFEKLGDLLTCDGRHPAAIETFEAARSEYQNVLDRARCLRKAAYSFQHLQDHKAAMSAVDRASAELEGISNPTIETRHEDIECRFQKFYSLYFLELFKEIGALIGGLEPLVEAYGTEVMTARLLQIQATGMARSVRYLPNERALELSRTAHDLMVGRAGVTAEEVRFVLGQQQLFCRSFEQAAETLAEAAHNLDRIGHRSMQLRCVVYQAQAVRMALDVPQTIKISERGLELCEVVKMREYRAALLAHRGWCDVRLGDDAAGLVRATEAVKLWAEQDGEGKAPYPLQWIARILLIRSALAAEDVEAAATQAEAMLLGHQGAAPADLDEILCRVEARNAVRLLDFDAAAHAARWL